MALRSLPFLVLRILACLASISLRISLTRAAASLPLDNVIDRDVAGSADQESETFLEALAYQFDQRARANLMASFCESFKEGVFTVKVMGNTLIPLVRNIVCKFNTTETHHLSANSILLQNTDVDDLPPRPVR
ncbi:hypothetical protein KCU83_g163, partial [Aureobasidium melanogenum]